MERSSPDHQYNHLSRPTQEEVDEITRLHKVMARNIVDLFDKVTADEIIEEYGDASMAAFALVRDAVTLGLSNHLTIQSPLPTIDMQIKAAQQIIDGAFSDIVRIAAQVFAETQDPQAPKAYITDNVDTLQILASRSEKEMRAIVKDHDTLIEHLTSPDENTLPQSSHTGCPYRDHSAFAQLTRICVHEAVHMINNGTIALVDHQQSDYTDPTLRQV